MRVNKALEQIHLITNLVGPAYEYEDQQVQRLLEALAGGVTQVAEAFRDGKVKRARFRLRQWTIVISIQSGLLPTSG